MFVLSFILLRFEDEKLSSSSPTLSVEIYFEYNIFFVFSDCMN